MPDVQADYLVSYWTALGMVENHGAGPSPLSPVTVQAWANATSVDLQPWEFAILLGMSRVYLDEFRQAEAPDRPPPYGDPINTFDRAAVSKRIGNAFKAFIQAKK
jgi:hypothetical protein